MSATGNALDSTATDVAEFIDRVLSAGHATPGDTLATTDLSISQLRMLFVLLRSPEPQTVNEVAEGVDLSVAAAGRAADRLVAAGLVDRREDNHDRRMKRLSLTADGHDLLDTSFRLRASVVERLLTGMPDEVRTELGDAVSAALDYLPPRAGCAPAARTAG